MKWCSELALKIILLNTIVSPIEPLGHIIRFVAKSKMFPLTIASYHSFKSWILLSVSAHFLQYKIEPCESNLELIEAQNGSFIVGIKNTRNSSNWKEFGRIFEEIFKNWTYKFFIQSKQTELKAKVYMELWTD